MPWVRALLHGQRVYARAKPDGSILADGDRVEVCYTPNAQRTYRARASNLVVEDKTLLPDEACSPGPAPAGDAPAAGRSGRAGGARATAKAKGSSLPPDPPKDAVIAYADGACSGNPGPSGLGVVLIDGKECTEISEHLGEGTNNTAELNAVRAVLDAVKDPARPLVIYTDSGYAIGVLSKGWKAKANVELIQGLRQRLAKRPRTTFVHVRGHAGVPLNERADELAREAVRTRRSRSERIARGAG